MASLKIGVKFSAFPARAIRFSDFLQYFYRFACVSEECFANKVDFCWHFPQWCLGAINVCICVQFLRFPDDLVRIFPFETDDSKNFQNLVSKI